MMPTAYEAEPITVLDRYDLYMMVWTDPVATVAQRLGVSDVGLQKVCRRHNIPTPNRGYWAKRRAGVRVAPSPLPYGEGKIAFHGARQQCSENSSNPPPTEPNAGELLEPTSAPAPAVDDLLRRRFLPELKPTREHLASSKAGRQEFAESHGPKLFPIKVSKKLLPRALRIANALLLAGLPHQVTLSRSAGHLDVAGEPVRARLVEKGTWEQRLIRPGSSYVTQVLVPTGVLCFEVEEWLASPRRRWSDTKTRTLEQAILGIVDALIRTAECIRARRLQMEEEDWQRWLREQARQLEADRVQFLDKMAAKVGQLRTARAVLEFAEGQLNGPTSSTTNHWLGWLRARLQRLEGELGGPGLERLVQAARCFEEPTEV